MGELSRAMIAHAGDSHKRLCPGRNYTCDCRYDENTEYLLLAAAAYIKTLEQEVESLQYRREQED
jgi:hypothetical protein